MVVASGPERPGFLAPPRLTWPYTLKAEARAGASRLAATHPQEPPSTDPSR
ncbi:hypothetical protein [Nonomuraea sp. NPDC001023]|uniref:hypothetical protein n=1 Tax=unclassified Nonomuraea TaxID=2593643 RepID=UPI00331FFA55